MNAQQPSIGLIGLGTMGAALALNIAENGFAIAVFNRTVSRIPEFVAAAGDLGERITPSQSLEEFVAAIARPRRIILMVPAGQVVDDQIAALDPLLDEGDIMTAGGILAWADLGLTLVDRLLGPATMLATARFLLVEPPRQSQRRFAQFVPRFDHADEAIRQSQHHIHAQATTLQGVADLAAAAGMTGRTYLRRFSAATSFTPVEYLQQVRIARAREALERTLTPVDRIAWDVGYSDPAAFRKLFQKLTGLPPAAYRQQFGIAAEAQ